MRNVDEAACRHDGCRARHDPALRKKHGWMWVDRITCPGCGAEVILRVYDDERDDTSLQRLNKRGAQER